MSAAGALYYLLNFYAQFIMKYNTAITITLLLAAAGGLVACGQTGPLYHASEASAAKPLSQGASARSDQSFDQDPNKPTTPSSEEDPNDF